MIRKQTSITDDKFMLTIYKRYHKISALTLASLLFTILLSPVKADEKPLDIPKPLNQALTTYKDKGIKAFINTLVIGSPLAGHQEMQTQVSILEKIESYYGEYQSYYVVHSHDISDSTRIVYFLLNYERGPVFGKLTAFKNKNRETITAFRFHTKEEDIFPEALLTSHHP